MKPMIQTYVLGLSVCVFFGQVSAQNVPVHAQGLTENLVSVELGVAKKQEGVLSIKSGHNKPTHLAVLLPGSPSVVRPMIENNVMQRSLLTGNFLIRARRFLVDESIATLIVDCPSDSGDECTSSYQASKQREQDVSSLIGAVKKQLPTITQVWLVGTSMGTISSAYMPLHNPSAFAGVIHTASITQPYVKNSYRELGDFDYKKINIFQTFVHHFNDPCPLTTYAGAQRIAQTFGVALMTVRGSDGVQGPACKANTEHGFKGKEKEVMHAIGGIIKAGRADFLEIN